MQHVVECVYKSLNHKGEELCGDKVEIVRTADADILILADGLGSGVKANILSTLTSKIISTMIQEGAPLEDTIETISSTLPLCSVRHLAYSTFTILQIYHDGRAHLVEFDNPACFCLRKGELIRPAYIKRQISGKEIRESFFQVELWDYYVLVSDGVIYAGVGETLNFGWTWDNVADYLRREILKRPSAHRLANLLSSACNDLYMGKPGDDTTVAVAKVIQASHVHLLASPPQDKKDDERMVQDFLQDSDIRIICGGSSGNMVARVLNKPLRASLEYLDPAVPPTAEIEGIQLVTEGVLTLSKTLEILRQCVSPTGEVQNLELLDAKNGAAQIAKILVERCTHLNLYIGQAINPAHQNPDLPFDLSIKFRLLEELAALARKLGRTVECYYY